MASTMQLDLDTERTMKQFKEFLLSYNKLSEMCFTDCAHDFTTRKVLESEDSCAKNCMDKYLKMTNRISQRFQEIQTQQQGDPSILAKQAGQTSWSWLPWLLAVSVYVYMCDGACVWKLFATVIDIWIAVRCYKIRVAN